VDRGEQFAAAVYPMASIANHSCVPNVKQISTLVLPFLFARSEVLKFLQIVHKPDEMGRMVFVASRDILPGEECCISYFDLTRFTDRDSRREHLRKSFKFPCQCEKCVYEELRVTKEESTLDEMPPIS
jgi:SET domain-containing protein